MYSIQCSTCNELPLLEKRHEAGGHMVDDEGLEVRDEED